MRHGPAFWAAVAKTVMIDATSLKAHRTATRLRAKEGDSGDQRERAIGRARGGTSTRLRAVTDADGRAVRFCLTTGPVSDPTGAGSLSGSPPKAEWLLAGLDHDADWFRDAFKDRGTRPCIPGRKSRGRPVRHAGRRHRRHHRIETMFAMLDDGRRVATRQDRCPRVLLSASALAATVIFLP